MKSRVMLCAKSFPEALKPSTKNIRNTRLKCAILDSNFQVLFRGRRTCYC